MTQHTDTPTGKIDLSSARWPDLINELKNRASDDWHVEIALSQAGAWARRSEYRRSIESIASEAVSLISGRDMASEDALSDWLHEEVDGCYWVIYYHAQMQAIEASDNDGAYEDSGEQLPPYPNALAVIAYHAVCADVLGEIDSAASGADWSVDDDTTWPANSAC